MNWDLNNGQRFVTAPPNIFDRPVIILSDLNFWNLHFEELKDWCDQNNCDVVGMTVEFPNETVVTLFCLRWS